jgi:YVTN family beta-propeller protein
MLYLLVIQPTAAPLTNEYNSNIYYWVCYGEAPANWTVSFTLNYPCGDKNLVSSTYDSYTYQATAKVFLTTGVEGDCYTPSIPQASTRFAILGQLPQTLTLSGGAPFVTTYGMPKLYVYDGTAALVATETATSVSSDGSQATFPFPSSLQQDGYSVAVANQTGASPGISAVGTNFLSIAGSQTIAGNPFGVSVGAQTHAFLDRNTCTRASTTSSTYLTFPIVSLYTKNQVLVDGTYVNVGANPTAVAAYQASPVAITSTYGCDLIKNTYSGTTRAIVTNSGGNTASILDIVNDSLLTTITVGSQPVAVVTASDGSAAYVANYKDSAISRIDLKLNTVTNTVAVGGKPTSVALTSGGILWVGGAGFLTEINTATMAVVGTESAANKNIVALGYSDSVNEIIAITADSSGNVIADELNPSAFQAGGSYTPVASNIISSLGTYTSQPSGQLVRAFTSTLASSTTISSSQPGAPPLVVQDGWAVVAATPTGFSITDASSHQVLISEKTPSPVTAIAVDSKLNVAYLTMPDSNILLSVPLPGTN